MLGDIGALPSVELMIPTRVRKNSEVAISSPYKLKRDSFPTDGKKSGEKISKVIFRSSEPHLCYQIGISSRTQRSLLKFWGRGQETEESATASQGILVPNRGCDICLQRTLPNCPYSIFIQQQESIFDNGRRLKYAYLYLGINAECYC
jgi:hypothetical protein